MSYNKISHKILLVAILLISFFGMNLEEGEAAVICPAGYSSYPIMNILVGDCYYNIDICYKCGPMGVSSSFIKIVRMAIVDPNCVQSTISSADELIDAAINAIITSPVGYLGLLCSIPPCCELPEDQPCVPALKRQFTIVKPICWRIMKLTDGKVVWEACEDEMAACVKPIFACTRGSNIIWDLTTSFSLENGWTLNCDTYDDGNFSPGRPLFIALPINTWSPCFKVRNLCNGY